MKKHLSLFFFTSIFLIYCTEKPDTQTSSETIKTAEKATDSSPTTVRKDTIADAATIIQREQVPILCYHRIQDNGKPADYTVTTQAFKEQLKLLADSGYHSILPEELHAYLSNGAALPSKPFMLTFDDTRLEHYTIAATEMEKYGFKGVFFVMTIPIGRPNYMNAQQIKELADRGHVIGSHTWDHHNVKKLQGEDWLVQIKKPKEKLEGITGKPVDYFAYPFGVWNDSAASEIKKHAFKAAFQLTEKRSTSEPLYTIRRTLVPGSWPTSQLLKRMGSMF